MRLKHIFLAATLTMGLSAAAPVARGQSSQVVTQAGAAPEVINIVHEALIPGRETSYAGLLAKIAGGYSRAKIPVYWLESQSLTGALDSMSLNFFNSFADAESVYDALNTALAAHPELVPMQDQLLAYTSSVTNALAVRRDDIGYRVNAIDFSKARVLRIATVVVRQGHESEFVEAMKNLSAAFASASAESPWVVYQVNAGAPATTFVIIMPMSSLGEMDNYVGREKLLRESEGEGTAGRMQEIASAAYVSWDNEIYIVNPQDSHVSEEFAAGDPRFWTQRN
jgi:hypothetical protein